MALNYDVLHSHSLLERDFNIPKHSVIIDEKFACMFGDDFIEDKFTYKGINYCRVPTILIVNKGGVFKAFKE